MCNPVIRMDVTRRTDPRINCLKDSLNGTKYITFIILTTWNILEFFLIKLPHPFLNEAKVKTIICVRGNA